MSAALEEVVLTYRVSVPVDGLLLEDEDVPETPLHDAIIELLMGIWKYHARGRSALICSNLACRWNPADARVGTDPDLVWIEPAPNEGEDLGSLRVWEPQHHPPRVVVEVVSLGDPAKDYFAAPLAAGLLGTRELWVFDPRLAGPSQPDGPFRLQLWRRDEQGEMQRIYAGGGPAFSPELEAWVHVTDAGSRLRMANDESGSDLWPSPLDVAMRAEVHRKRAEAEAERAEAEAERAEAEAERAEAEAKRADAEAERAESERNRADALQKRLLELGADLDG